MKLILQIIADKKICVNPFNLLLCLGFRRDHLRTIFAVNRLTIEYIPKHYSVLVASTGFNFSAL